MFDFLLVPLAHKSEIKLACSPFFEIVWFNGTCWWLTKNRYVTISIWKFWKQRGGSLFFKNVWIRNSPQTPSEIRRINSLFWYFLMQICLFLCLPEDIYFHFDLFEWNLAFSNANRPFRMPVRGVSRHQNSLNFKNVSNRSEGGGQHFSKMSQIQKCLKCRRGRGGQP